MRTWSGQVLALAIATAHLFAQRGDSVRYVFRPVVVEDSLRRVVYAVPRAELNRNELVQLPATTVGDAVQAMPGVFVRNYGGLGGLKTVSLRGASATHTVVVLDGIRLNVAANGLVDLGQIPTSLVEHVAIERGSRSAAWGAGAIGGVLELSLHRATNEAAIVGGIGAFGERSLRFELAHGFGRHSISVAGDLQYSRGNYPFTFSEFGTVRRIERTNGDALLGSAVLQWLWQLPSVVTSLVVFGRTSERGAPGAVLQGAIENAAARLDDRELLAIGRVETGAESQRRWTFRFALRRFDQHYRDSLARFRGPSGADDRFSAFDVASVIEAPRLRSSELWLAPKAEAYLNTLRGNLYRIGAGSYAERLQLGAAIEAGWSHPLDSAQLVAVESALRGDLYSDVGSAVTGSLQLRWLPQTFPVGGRASIGTSYRPPSFNELYYQNFGSTDVRPERSFDVNLGASLVGSTLRCDLDAFALWIRDQIIAVPRSAITWSVQNAGRVFSRGAELLLDWRGDRWRMVASGTYQRVTYDDRSSFTYGRQVIYTPELVGMARLEHRLWDAVVVMGQVTYLGTRYTQTDNAPSSALDPAVTFDLSLRVGLPMEPLVLVLEADALNLFDAQYAIVRNFPMPGRSWRLRVGARWNGGA